MQFLKQNTAGQVIRLGPFISDSDFTSKMTSLTINASDIKLYKGAATSEVNKNSGGATHVNEGRYHATLDATDTNTVGALDVFCKMSGALEVWRQDLFVLPANIYDAWTGADRQQVDVLEINGSTPNLQNLDRFMQGCVTFTFATGTLTDRRATTSITGYASGSLKKRLLVVLTGARAGETARIVDYVSTNGDISYTPLSGAPANGDIGILLPY